ncbi:hypothetical protein SAMN04489834_0242 [Microterricola viridarii]|uniref:Uncharacterized protein n=1 Tax=Microterricola viridarii TaxID=412690 RepID=A0A1H1LXG3_9MICO|nr:hypothetical protein SAMN04489834_0242 [Microterricola viridarii]
MGLQHGLWTPVADRRAQTGGRSGHEKGRHPRVTAESRGALSQRQRVVMRKPMKAIPNPTRMFHEPSAATGQAPWLT